MALAMRMDCSEVEGAVGEAVTSKGEGEGRGGKEGKGRQ
jgi:hypothetical protein